MDRDVQLFLSHGPCKKQSSSSEVQPSKANKLIPTSQMIKESFRAPRMRSIATRTSLVHYALLAAAAGGAAFRVTPEQWYWITTNSVFCICLTIPLFSMMPCFRHKSHPLYGSEKVVPYALSHEHRSMINVACSGMYNRYAHTKVVERTARA